MTAVIGVGVMENDEKMVEMATPGCRVDDLVLPFAKVDNAFGRKRVHSAFWIGILVDDQALQHFPPFLSSSGVFSVASSSFTADFWCMLHRSRNFHQRPQGDGAEPACTRNHRWMTSQSTLHGQYW